MPFQGINLTNSDYVPQYQGIPLEAIERVGDELQDRHYKNIANASQLDILANQQLADTRPEADRAILQKEIEGIRGGLAEMAKNGGENATARVNALVTNFMGNEKIQNIKRNAANLIREDEEMAKLGASGVLNKKQRDEFLKQGSFDQDGNYRPYLGSAQKQLDYIQKADQIFDPLKANTYQTDLEADLKTTLAAYGIDKIIPGVSGDISKLPAKYKTTLIEKLSEDKIRKFADEQGGWKSYQDSAEYNQQKNVLDLSDAEIKKEFMSRGYAKVYEKIQKDWENNPALGALGAGSGKTPTSGPGMGVEMPNMRVNYKDNIDLSDFEYRDRLTSTGETVYDPSSGLQVMAGTTTKKPGVNPNISPEKWNKFNERAKIAAEVFGMPNWDKLNANSSEKDIKEATEAVRKYQEFLSNRVINPIKHVEEYEALTQADRTELILNLRNNYESAVFYDPQSNKVINPTKDGKMNPELMDLLGKGGFDNTAITGDVDPKHHYAKMANTPALGDARVLQIRDPETGEVTKELFVTNPAKSNSFESAYNQAVNTAYSSFNLEPGKEQTVEMFGQKIKGKELAGRQFEEYISGIEDSKEKQTILAVRDQLGRRFMPILAEVNGEKKLFNGPDHLASYLANRK
jgi:hypothetical protein